MPSTAIETDEGVLLIGGPSGLSSESHDLGILVIGGPGGELLPADQLGAWVIGGPVIIE